MLKELMKKLKACYLDQTLAWRRVAIYFAVVIVGDIIWTSIELLSYGEKRGSLEDTIMGILFSTAIAYSVVRKRESTQEIFDKLESRLIPTLEGNEEQCPKCGGLKLMHGDGYLTNCTRCYSGKLYKCEHCGTLNKTDFCRCRESENARNLKHTEKQIRVEKELFNKATKLNFSDYKGMFIINGTVMDSDSVSDWIHDKVIEDEESLPKYLWGASKELVIDSINLCDVISNMCEDADAYEEAYEYLNPKDSESIIKAQKIVDKWLKNNSANDCYCEDHTVVILIEDEIEEMVKLQKEGIEDVINFREENKNE